MLCPENFHLGNPENVNHLDRELLTAIYQRMIEMVQESINKIKTSADDIPVALVGAETS